MPLDVSADAFQSEKILFPGTHSSRIAGMEEHPTVHYAKARNCVPSCHQTPLCRFWCAQPSCPSLSQLPLLSLSLRCSVPCRTSGKCPAAAGDVSVQGFEPCEPGSQITFQEKTLPTCTNPTLLFSSVGSPYFQSRKYLPEIILFFRLSLPRRGSPNGFLDHIKTGKGTTRAKSLILACLLFHALLRTNYVSCQHFRASTQG